MLAEMPLSEELGGLLYEMAKAAAVDKDEWLSQAVYDGAARHRAGFFKAYTADLGAAQFRSLADKISKEEQTPRAAPPPGAPPRLIGQSMAPVSEKLLHAYVEDIVGPITRPAPPTAGFGGGGGGRGGRGANFTPVGGGGGARGGAPTGPPLVINIKTIHQHVKYS